MTKEKTERPTATLSNEWENDDFAMAEHRLIHTATRMGLDDDVISPLRQPKRCDCSSPYSFG